MKKEVLDTVFKSLKFLAILFLVDLALGLMAKKVFFAQETGKQARITYTIDEADSQIMIFGSSHANRHYVPEIFEKQLGKTCYNAGVQGQGILFQDALQKIVLKRTQPELVVLNIDDIWLYERNDNYDRLSDFHPYYWGHREILKPLLSLKSKLIDFRLTLKSYQFNSTIVHAIKYFFSPQKDFEGYLPLKGEIKGVQKKKVEDENYVLPPLDPNFIAAFQSFIKTTRENNIDLVIVISPWFEKNDFSNNKSMQALLQITKDKKVPVLDFYNDERFLYKKDLFNDTSHLNDKGARYFSELVSKHLVKD